MPLGLPVADGSAGPVRGVVVFETQSARFARLSAIVGLMEIEEDEQGNSRVKLWEWK